MNDRTKLVFAGWCALSESERKELEAEIAKYKQKGSWEQDSIRKSMERFSESVSLGPLSSGSCPCCGR